MDLNVCSRRVHDGYATIRSRGRSRPRAVYRSDSEELLKDAGGPYALPQVSNSPLSQEQIHQVPRWSDSGTNKLLENYGTLRRSKKTPDSSIPDRREEKIALNTFSSSKNHLENHQGNKNDRRPSTERLYDSVPTERHRDEPKITRVQPKVQKTAPISQAVVAESHANVYDPSPQENAKRIARRRSEGVATKAQSNYDDRTRGNVTNASRQPIYAVPNVPRSSADNKFDSRLTTDENYVPSGDLYRTTARYIEDINRNIAEIDKSYEELRCSSTSGTRNSAYGVINKIPRSSEQLLDQSPNDDNLYGFHRKRDTLVPMPPISPNFGENADDRLPGTPIFITEPNDCSNPTKFDFKIPRNHSTDSTRDSVRARPNSYGKLPPKLLPRSSSIENNSSRHSTGSTTTSSSTKSTESLYAISESLTDLQRREHSAHVAQSPRKDWFECAKKSAFSDTGSEFNYDFVTMRGTRLEAKADHSRSQTTTTSRRTGDDDTRAGGRQDRLPIGWNVRVNRGCCSGDDVTGYGKSVGEITGANGGRANAPDSATLREKDRSPRRAATVNATGSTVANTNAASQSRSSRQPRKIVDLESEDEEEIARRPGTRRTRHEKTMISGRAAAAARSGKDRSGSSLSGSGGSTGTIRRSRCSSRTTQDCEDCDVDDEDDDDDDDETSLIGSGLNERRARITSSSSMVQFCSDKKSRSSRGEHSDKRNDRPDVPKEKNPFQERRYGTLPYRRSKTARPLHKSSEDVLDGERIPAGDPGSLQRSCMSTLDVRAQSDDTRKVGGDPFYMMDATEVILKGQFERTVREKLLAKEEMETREKCAVEIPVFVEDKDNFSRQTWTRFSGNARTRHNSLESEEVENSATRTTNEAHQANGTGAFATLPRRGNTSKEQRVSDTPRRLSGNVPVLEPLYEHAVSDPVKPRGNDNNVIPWWELATRKYRHRSCPALQDHVVQAFEQSLSNMNQRLKQLTATAEKKDSELQELRDTIERLRKQSAEAGLNGAASNGRRHTLGDSDSGTTGCTGYSNHQGPSMARQLSADSVTSLNSLSSACSASSHRKKKGWLGSFSKKFSRSRKNRHGSVSDAEDCKDGPGELSAPNSPRLPTAAKHEHAHGQSQAAKVANGQKSPEHENPMTGSKSSSALYKKEDEDVDELKKQLRQKDLVLAEITLEALSLKDEVYKMKNQMNNLKQNNERLQQLVTSKSLTSSQSSLPNDPERRFSVAALSNGDHHTSNSDQMEDLSGTEHTVMPSYASSTTTSETVMEQDTDGKRINVAVYLGSEKSFNVNLVSGNNDDGVGEPPHCVIASVCISNKTTWDALDSTVRRCFKDYVTRVDPVTNLGLSVDYVAAYHLGEASRFTNDSQHPELLPCGYLIGHVKTIYLVLSGYSWLAVDTLIPKSIVQRLVSLLTEHRRLILCGPTGTGKSYLAGKLAHALVDDDADADADSKDAAAVATFNVDHKSSKDLTQYLAHIADRCDSNAADELPKVIILENLQHAASLGELFSGLLGTRHSSCPAIIGTMSQSACSTTNLQLHHNFRWVLCRKDMEPVKGFLGRYLRRRLLEHQLRENGGPRNAEMAAVVEWLPRVWLHLNKFLETHSGSDVTITPTEFLLCPMEVAASQVWFVNLWNYSIIPYLADAVKEGNAEAAWENPTQFITSSYPWIATYAANCGSDALKHLRPEDVGYDVVSSGHNSGVGASSVRSLGSTHSDTEGDPLLNMLMRLQEAANYSSPHSNDSDSVTSMDSSHTRHSEDLSTSTSSSRGVESAL